MANRRPDGTPYARRARLSDIASVRLALARTIRKLEKGEMESKLGSTLVYAYKTLADIIQVKDIEERVRRLEESGKQGPQQEQPAVQ